MSSAARLSAGILLFRRGITATPAESLLEPAPAGSPPEPKPAGSPPDLSAPRSVVGAQVLIGHMGGPLWARRHESAWSIPKGEVLDGEEPFTAAMREFEEELGVAPPSTDPHRYRDLGSVRQSGGKTVRVWALESDLDEAAVEPGTFEMEWPPRSGRLARFPELDRVAWVCLDDARQLLVRAQREFVDRLLLDDRPSA